MAVLSFIECLLSRHQTQPLPDKQYKIVLYLPLVLFKCACEVGAYEVFRIPLIYHYSPRTLLSGTASCLLPSQDRTCPLIQMRTLSPVAQSLILSGWFSTSRPQDGVN